MVRTKPLYLWTLELSKLHLILPLCGWMSFEKPDARLVP